MESAIGWLAPPLCINCGQEGCVLCRDCAIGSLRLFGERCWNCGGLSRLGRTCGACRRAGGPRAVWVHTTYEDTARELIRGYKFGQQRAASESLAGLMSDVLLGNYGKTSVRKQDYLVVPVPTATSRARQRGFDHAALLAKKIAHRLGAEYAPALRRLGQNRQLGTTRAQRLAQPAGHYFARRPAAVNGRNILLIDDVMTTGGTINECARVLRAAGAAHVDTLIFAKKL